VEQLSLITREPISEFRTPRLEHVERPLQNASKRCLGANLWDARTRTCRAERSYFLVGALKKGLLPDPFVPGMRSTRSLSRSVNADVSTLATSNNLSVSATGVPRSRPARRSARVSLRCDISALASRGQEFLRSLNYNSPAVSPQCGRSKGGGPDLRRARALRRTMVNFARTWGRCCALTRARVRGRSFARLRIVAPEKPNCFSAAMGGPMMSPWVRGGGSPTWVRRSLLKSVPVV
jgi:hypothetical protein